MRAAGRTNVNSDLMLPGCIIGAIVYGSLWRSQSFMVSGCHSSRLRSCADTFEPVSRQSKSVASDSAAAGSRHSNRGAPWWMGRISLNRLTAASVQTRHRRSKPRRRGVAWNGGATPSAPSRAVAANRPTPLVRRRFLPFQNTPQRLARRPHPIPRSPPAPAGRHDARQRVHRAREAQRTHPVSGNPRPSVISAGARDRACDRGGHQATSRGRMVTSRPGGSRTAYGPWGDGRPLRLESEITRWDIRHLARGPSRLNSSDHLRAGNTPVAAAAEIMARMLLTATSKWRRGFRSEVQSRV
jgi:hypothetical protein